jgi:hypothetical protein
MSIITRILYSRAFPILLVLALFTPNGICVE